MEETNNNCLFVLLISWPLNEAQHGVQNALKAGVSTYEGSLVGHGGQDVIEDEQQDGDGQQYGDFEAQLLSSAVFDEEGGEVQNQEEQDGQQEVGDVEEWPPLHGELEK